MADSRLVSSEVLVGEPAVVSPPATGTNFIGTLILFIQNTATFFFGGQIG